MSSLFETNPAGPVHEKVVPTSVVPVSVNEVPLQTGPLFDAVAVGFVLTITVSSEEVEVTEIGNGGVDLYFNQTAIDAFLANPNQNIFILGEYDYNNIAPTATWIPTVNLIEPESFNPVFLGGCAHFDAQH